MVSLIKPSSIAHHGQVVRHGAETSADDMSPDLASADYLALLPRDFAREHLILSQGTFDGRERLVVGAGTHPCAVFNTSVLLRRPVDVARGNDERIARIIDEAYARRRQDTPSLLVEDTGCEAPQCESSGIIDELIALADRNLLSTQGKAPVTRLVDAMLFDALQRRASDLHIQPIAAMTLIRFRLDGVLQTVRQISRDLTNAVVSRLKVMGRMDIAERRLPQDGRATVMIGDRSIDLRISSLPTSFGERVVVRLLDNSRSIATLEQTGMPSPLLEHYLDRATRSNGTILLTGPTGSGKTTTLYSTLRRVGSAALNVMTIEDPVEYDLSSTGQGIAISQSQVNPRKGITFATGLRHILRQDPDVVMVGEIRDAETARIAIQSSLTGHLVFSTLHTNDASSAVTRLNDLGIEPYLVGAALSAVLAQRLVRTLHDDCHGRGCETCLGTGFRGRTGLFELLLIDDAVRDIVSASASPARIREAGRAAGMRSLQEDGERLIRSGRTTPAEVHRVVQGIG